MGFRRLGYAVVLVRDFAAMRDWYRGAAGFEVGDFDETGDHKWVEFRFPEGGGGLALHGGVHLPVIGVMATIVPSIEVTDIEGMVAELKGRGVEFVREVHEVAGHVRTADFRDPEGNLIQMFEPMGGS